MKTRIIATGTILAFGITGAGASLTGMTVNYRSGVDDLLQYDGFEPSVIGNENFDITGGSELLTFNASAAGGDVFQSLPFSEVFVDASGALTSNGGFMSSVDLDANAGGFFDIPDSVDAFVSSTIEFTIDETMGFELIVFDYWYSNDAGGGGIGLENLGTGDYYGGTSGPGEIGPGNPDIVSGTIGAGTYRLSAAMNYGIAEYGFSLVPAPSSMMLLGFGGVCVARRRR